MSEEHQSDCARHNAPAEEPGECDCELRSPLVSSRSETQDTKAASSEASPQEARSRKG